MDGGSRRKRWLPVAAVLAVLVLVAAGLGIDKLVGSSTPVAASTHANTIAAGASSSPTPGPSATAKAKDSRRAKSAGATTAPSSPGSRLPASPAPATQPASQASCATTR